MDLTKGQQAALDMVAELLKTTGVQVAVLEGYAGTGKTTLIGELRTRLGIEEAIVLTPTGKAAVRAREVMDYPAMTIHRFMYKPIENKDTGEVTFAMDQRKLLEASGAKLIIVDEASMVGRELWDDLLEVCDKIGDVKILLVGDGFQLPPVGDVGSVDDWCALDVKTPFRVRLDEVLRQAMDSPVIKAATMVRAGSGPHQLVGLLRCVTPDKLPEQAMLAWDTGAAVLVHTNKLRAAMNSWIRRRKGLPPDLTAGEPLLVLQNNYDLDRYNGEVVRFDGWVNQPGRGRSARVRGLDAKDHPLEFCTGNVDGATEVILCPEQVVGSVDGKVSPSFMRKAGQRMWGHFVDMGDYRLYEGPPYLHANYGYVLTCHKAQGSEWDEVLLVVEPTIRIGTEEGQRHLYTGITRAREECRLALVPWHYAEKL